MKQMIKALLAIPILLLAAKLYAKGPGSIDRKVKRILIVVTSVGQVSSNGKPTGLWLEEFAAPYYLFQGAGVEITVASPQGGKAPVDPKSIQPDYLTETTKKFLADPAAQEKLNNTIRLGEVNPRNYDAVYYPGGTGPTWDLPEDRNSIRIIETFYRSGKPTALVCHAPAALKNVHDTHGDPLIKGKKIAGYSNSEEAAGQSTDMVAFSLEDMVKSEGGTYVKGEDWHSFVVSEGNLITGQNPASSLDVAKKILDFVKVSY
jgi:putative intracellular protease/amidase